MDDKKSTRIFLLPKRPIDMANNEKAVKSAYLTAEERKLCKMAALQLDLATLEDFYSEAISWYLKVHKDFPFEFAKKPDAKCVSIWMTEDLSKKVDKTTARTGVSVANFMHTAFVLYLEKHGYFEGEFYIDWPGRDK